MAKKKGGQRGKGSCMDFAEYDDSSSIASSSTMCSGYQTGNEPDVVETDEFQAKLDDLFEKRGSTREKAFEALVTMLKEDVRLEDCVNSTETIVSRCTGALRKGSPTESLFAAQMLGLHILTLAEPNESLFEEVQPDLERAMAASGKGPAAQVAAVDALVLATYVMAEDERATQVVMARLRALWSRGEPRVQAAAVRGWSLLFTALNQQLPRPVLEQALGDLADRLQASDAELRTAAGEAVALLHDTAGIADLPSSSDGEDDDLEGSCSEAEEAGQQPSVASSGGAMAGLEDVMDRMKDLATNRGDKLRRSRRTRASQRQSFRSLCASMAGRPTPNARVKLQHGDVLTVQGLTANLALSWFRRFLAGGFQAHLQYNPLLHDVFGYKPRAGPAEKLSALEKRHMRSPSSADAKWRTASRKHDRASKVAAHGGF